MRKIIAMIEQDENGLIYFKINDKRSDSMIVESDFTDHIIRIHPDFSKKNESYQQEFSQEEKSIIRKFIHMLKKYRSISKQYNKETELFLLEQERECEQ